ncbi:MAG TPA: hypothetical protein P5265_05520, partial [Bacteroidia bacterium]|nr:hypothetical protein [Bacteroidia bacterium]
MKASAKSLWGKFTVAMTILLILSSCSVKKYLNENQYLLRKTKVANAESALQYELSELMKQKVRKKLIGIDLPLTGLYLHLDRK